MGIRIQDLRELRNTHSQPTKMARRKKLMCMELSAAGYDTHEDLFCDRYADRKAKEMAVLARVPFCQKLKRLLQPLPGLVLASAATTYDLRGENTRGLSCSKAPERGGKPPPNREPSGPRPRGQGQVSSPGPQHTSSPSQLPNGQWPMANGPTRSQEVNVGQYRRLSSSGPSDRAAGPLRS
jgi:hypothetical protein